MKLATHNSLTYLEPKNPLMKLFKFCYQCQDKKIHEQLNDGVRYFDFRLAFDSNRLLEVRHKLIAFNCNYTDFMDILRMMNHKKGVVVRMVLEKNTKETDEEDFRIICKYIEEHFKNIAFCCGEDVHSKKVVYQFKTGNSPQVIERYSSVTGRLIDGLFPKRWAKRHNREIIEENKDTDKYLMVDFYELK